MVSENVFLFHALLMGIYISFIYDILRILRRVIPHNGFLVSLEDLGFWIYCAAEVFLLMYYESNGNLRWFAVLGALAGMLAYRRLVSGILVKYVSLLLKRLLEILGRAFRWILGPFVRLGRKAGRGARKAGVKIARIAGRIRRRIKNRLTRFLKLFKMNLRK
ncbi:MAG: spore cortex biosynthesis protein YabQ [Roseburia sp.]|nr:spore cortex biosynthesis protein YabQ [Roseburia sp.]MCM1096687.1 spore cortex biosynthesis protein YabQ [Ruminococcus flavefaciens]